VQKQPVYFADNSIVQATQIFSQRQTGKYQNSRAEPKQQFAHLCRRCALHPWLRLFRSSISEAAHTFQLETQRPVSALLRSHVPWFDLERRGRVSAVYSWVAVTPLAAALKGYRKFLVCSCGGTDIPVTVCRSSSSARARFGSRAALETRILDGQL
jgi:hypothetical protein